ncbi:MAG: polymerase [Acidimicrobiaceae bacterium]|nr:polymerase [Acidimicrobiaceae bacterium]
MATILHVDMDAFFAAVEVRLDPSLAGKPVVVGGSGRRGVVAAASYEARAYGVHSAMPSGQARRLCPNAVFVAGRYDRYSEVSEQIHQIFQAYTPLVEGIALDEAFLDVTGATGLFGDGLAIGRQIRQQVQSELGLSSSVGVAASKFVAKLASEAAKPRASASGVIAGAGVVVVEPGEELGFLHPKPVEALWGVGPVTASRLRGLGVATVGELAAIPLDTLERCLGVASGRHLHELAWGRDPRRVEPNRAVQSIGHEETYPWDRDDRGELNREVVRMADAVAGRMRAAGVTGRTVTLKLRYGDFSTITRSRTLGIGIDTGPAIARAVEGLLDQVPVAPGVRLLGVSVANLAQGAPHQLAMAFGSAAGAAPGAGPGAGPGTGPAGAGPGTGPGTELAGAGPGTGLGTGLGAEPGAGRGPSKPPTRATPRSTAPQPQPSSEMVDESWHDATRAVDRVRARFGPGAVGPAALLDEKGLRLKRAGDTQWGPTHPPSEAGETGTAEP